MRLVPTDYFWSFRRTPFFVRRLHCLYTFSFAAFVFRALAHTDVFLLLGASLMIHGRW